MPPNVNASKPKKSNAKWSKQLVFPILFTLLALLLTFIFGYFPATKVTGTEFNTSTWSIREFQYRQDPFSKVQLTGVIREIPTSIYSSQAGFPFTYIKASPTSSRWDLAEIRNGRNVTEGPANILLTYLRASKDLSTDFWPDWSKKNSVKADVLWPAVSDLVDLELYYRLPSVMEAALVECSDDEFKTKIHSAMTSALQVYVAQPLGSQAGGSSPPEASKLAEELLKKYQDASRS